MPNISKKMVIEVSQNGAEKTAAALGTLDKAQARVAGSGGQANLVLLNTTRVIQDMPYGLIAVSNNVDMLVQQFISLRASSGSTIGALSAIKASLMGPSGLLFLFSAGVSALTMYALANRETEKTTKELNTSLEDRIRLERQLAETRFGMGDLSRGSYRKMLEDDIRRYQDNETVLRVQLAESRRQRSAAQVLTGGKLELVPASPRRDAGLPKPQPGDTKGELDLIKKIEESVSNRVASEQRLNSLMKSRRVDIEADPALVGLDVRSKGQLLAAQKREENIRRREERGEDAYWSERDRNAENEIKRQKKIEEAQRNLFSGFNQMNSSMQTLGVTSDSVLGKILNYLNQIYAVIQLINSVKTIASAVTTLFSGVPGGAAGGVGNLEAVLAVPENRRALAYTVRDMSRKGIL